MSCVLLAVLAQMAVLPSPAQILVRGSAGSDTLAVWHSPSGARVSAKGLASPLGGSVKSPAPGRFRLEVAGKTVEFLDGAPFAKVGDRIHPMAAAPVLRDGAPWIPLHFVTEILQEVATGVLYDPVYLELRQFAGNAARVQPVAVVKERAASPPRRTTAGSSNRQTARAQSSRSSNRFVVVVDAGHGGQDPGMHGRLPSGQRIQEKDITLQVAHKVAASLKARGYDVIMTRSTDTLIALSDRGRIANAARGDLFLSIHVNAANPRWAKPSAARGVETYFLAEAKSEDERRVEQMENEATRFEVAAEADAGDPLSFLLTDMKQNEHLRESSDLAGIVQRHLAGVHPGPNRGVKQAGFRVLVTAYMPAVLIEIGFGTNPDEAAFISDPAQQRRMADAIAGAADSYFERYERRVAGSAGP
jgi:N-acetylmuramoyl-L-alanine amidase